MASLGEFGAELALVDETPDDPDTFLLYGHEFTVRPRISSLPALRYAHTAQQVVAAEERATAAAQRARTDEQRAAAARAMGEVELAANAGLYAYLRDMIVPEEWERFEQVAAEHGLQDDDLLAIAGRIMAAVAARPTTRSSGSPAGPSDSGGTSPDGSASSTSPGPVVVLAERTPAEAARIELLEEMVPVGDLVRSGG